MLHLLMLAFSIVALAAVPSMACVTGVLINM